MNGTDMATWTHLDHVDDDRPSYACSWRAGWWHVFDSEPTVVALVNADRECEAEKGALLVLYKGVELRQPEIVPPLRRCACGVPLYSHHRCQYTRAVAS